MTEKELEREELEKQLDNIKERIKSLDLIEEKLLKIRLLAHKVIEEDLSRKDLDKVNRKVERLKGQVNQLNRVYIDLQL